MFFQISVHTPLSFHQERRVFSLERQQKGQLIVLE